jgi:hypothetical protein
MAVSVLDQEMYTEAEAARLLRVPQSTLNYWQTASACPIRLPTAALRE